MSSAQLCLLLMLTHIKFTHCQNDKFDVQWDQTLSKDDQGLKCGIEKNKNKAPSSARIINGDLIHDARYPWMAQIVDILFYSNDTANFKLECGGSVIFYLVTSVTGMNYQRLSRGSRVTIYHGFTGM